MSDVAVSATGLLREFNEAGVLTWADVHPAQHLCHLYGEPDQRVQLAAALCVRALRAGSLAVDLGRVASSVAAWELAGDDAPDDAESPAAVPALAWPEPTAWWDALAASPAVRTGPEDEPGAAPRPLRLVDGLLYLERYWRDQEVVRAHLQARIDEPQAPVGVLVPEPSGDPRLAGQDAAVVSALGRRVTVIAGGPGTGKTRVIARLVDAFSGGGRPLLIGLAAPTGKAAARMTESLRQAGGGGPVRAASTVHRLLGSRPGSRSRFRHDAANPLPHDVVIVDELSMVSMSLMARLLSALKPTARLVLVGDPDQLASVEAGAVLADLVAARAMQPSVVRLEHNFRFAGAIEQLASAIRTGDAGGALAVLAAGGREALLLPPGPGSDALRERSVAAGSRLIEAARRGDAEGALAALDAHRVLCAHRTGPFGVGQWERTIAAWLSEAQPGFAVGEFYVGRPLLMTRNAADLDLYNGDTGVVVPGRDGAPQAVFATGSGLKRYSPYLLDGLESVHAMTIHKSQGSQFRHVSVVLPPVGSPLLTRELLYTAVTRASDGVLIVGTPEAVTAAIERPAERTSGLASRLDQVTGGRSEGR